MHAEKSNFSIARMARLLEVSRSGFYAWLTRSRRRGRCGPERIEAKIAWFHGESDEVSGAPRILVDLRADGEVISRKTVAAAMRRLGLKGICPRRWRTTTIIDHADAYPARRGEPGLGHRSPEPDLGWRHHLPAHLARMAVSGHRDRRPLASGDRLGHRRAHARRPGRAGPADGDHAARRAAREGRVSRRPRHAIRIRAQIATKFARRQRHHSVHGPHRGVLG